MRAQLQGTYVVNALLQGADFSEAQLQGATLFNAQLQGANLREAQLQGAFLWNLYLQGANLQYTQLQGADIWNAQLKGADLLGAGVYRTRRRPVAPKGGPQAASADLAADTIGISQRRMIVNLPYTLMRNTTDARINADDPTGYRKFVEDSIARLSSEQKEVVRKRLAILCPNQVLKRSRVAQDYRHYLSWHYERRRSLSPDNRSQILGELACDGDGAPHVARGLIGKKALVGFFGGEVWNSRLAATGNHLEGIAERMRKSKPGRDGKAHDANACRGVKGFTDKDWQNLADLEKYVKEQLARDAKAVKPTAP